MDIRDRRSLKSAAAEALSAAPNDPKKLILLHTGIVLLLSLLLTVADYFLEKAIASTGGLGGMGTRSLLTTIQSCLRLAQMILLPFWQIGYTFVTMGFARREPAHFEDLAVGFARFFPILRLYLLQGALYLAIAMVSSYVGSFLFIMTTWSTPLMDAAMEMMNSGSMETLDAVMDSALAESFAPLMVCYLLVFLVLAAPFFYRFRLANFILLDQPEKGALFALKTSRSLMRGNTMALFKLDVSYWWFYALDLLVGIICYADALLVLLGVPLPVGADAAFFISFFAYLICQLGLYLWRRNEVSTTYAVFYDTLKQPKQKPGTPIPQNCENL